MFPREIVSEKSGRVIWPGVTSTSSVPLEQLNHIQFVLKGSLQAAKTNFQQRFSLTNRPYTVALETRPLTT